MKKELSIHEADYSHKVILDTWVNNPSEIFAIMLQKGGIPDHFLSDLYHDVLHLRDLYNEAEQNRESGIEIPLVFYYGIRDCGTDIGKSFVHTFIDKINAGMRFYSALKFTLKNRYSSTIRYQLIVEQIGIPTIARENQKIHATIGAVER